jgi:hypothetical protein
MGTDLLATSLETTLPKDRATLEKRVEDFIESTFAAVPKVLGGTA